MLIIFQNVSDQILQQLSCFVSELDLMHIYLFAWQLCNLTFYILKIQSISINIKLTFTPGFNILKCKIYLLFLVKNVYLLHVVTVICRDRPPIICTGKTQGRQVEISLDR